MLMCNWISLLCVLSHSVVSDSLWPHGLVPSQLPLSSGILQARITGVGCHALFQGIFPTQELIPGLLFCRWILYHLSHQGSLYVSPVFVILGSLDSWVSVNVLDFFMVTNLNLVFYFLMILMQYIRWFTWMSTWVWYWDFRFHIGVCVYSHMDAK